MSAEQASAYDNRLADSVIHAEADVLRLGRCRGEGILTELFFSDDVLDIARAKAICARCVVRAACLEGALVREEPWGVWGGELFSNGQIVWKNGPGRRPKVPKIIEIDEGLI